MENVEQPKLDPKHRDAVIADLTARRDLIAKGWCKGTYAQDETGVACLVSSDRAVSFCLLGAAMRVDENSGYPPSIGNDLIRQAAGRYLTIATINDSFDSADEVIDLLDRAITLAASLVCSTSP